MVLADLGAAVDKVEDPRAGDYARVYPPIVDGEGALFQQLNRGKRSLVLDLKAAGAAAAFRKLVGSYDVIVESFRPGVMERLGVDYPTLSSDHPGLIYCAITGFGQTGPLSKRAGHDLGYLARAGILGMTGPQEGPPQLPGALMADVAGGALYGVIGILGALRERDQTGQGQLVDIAMAEGAIGLGAFGYALAQGSDYQGRGEDLLSGGIAPYRTYRTRDGRSVALAALEPKFWMTFCAGVGLEPDMQALLPGPHQQAWMERIQEIVGSRDFEEWVRFSDDHDCCLEPVYHPAEVARDPHFVEREVFVPVPTYEGGTMSQFRTPAGRPEQPKPAPKRGADRAAILREADFSDEHIMELVNAGVVG